MAATFHEKAIKDYLESNGVTDVKPHPPTNLDQTGKFIIANGGPPMEGTFGDDEVLKKVALQIFIISEPNDPATAHQDARTIFDLLTNATPSGYLKVEPRQSNPIFLGADGDNRTRWSINVLAWIVE